MEIEQGINQGLSSPSELYAAAGNQSAPHGNADIPLVSRGSSVDDDVSTTGPSGCLGGSVVQVTQVWAKTFHLLRLHETFSAS